MFNSVFIVLTEYPSIDISRDIKLNVRDTFDLLRSILRFRMSLYRV